MMKVPLAVRQGHAEQRHGVTRKAGRRGDMPVWQDLEPRLLVLVQLWGTVPALGSQENPLLVNSQC